MLGAPHGVWVQLDEFAGALVVESGISYKPNLGETARCSFPFIQGIDEKAKNQNQKYKNIYKELVVDKVSGSNLSKRKPNSSASGSLLALALLSSGRRCRSHASKEFAPHSLTKPTSAGEKPLNFW